MTRGREALNAQEARSIASFFEKRFESVLTVTTQYEILICMDEGWRQGTAVGLRHTDRSVRAALNAAHLVGRCKPPLGSVWNAAPI
jgi:hypothetical protein